MKKKPVAGKSAGVQAADGRRAKKSTKRPASVRDDCRDPYQENLFAEPFDDYGDDIADPYADSYGSAPPGKKKKPTKKTSAAKPSRKKKSTGSNWTFIWGFHPNRMNIGLIAAGVFFGIYGCNESRLTARAGSSPTSVALADLISDGAGNNIYLSVSGVEPSTGEFVYEERGRGTSAYTKVWIPCIPAGTDETAAVKFVLFSSKARDDDDVGMLMGAGTHTGIIVNGIRSLASDERQLLQSSLGGTSPDEVLIFEVGRTPSGIGFIMLSFLGSAACVLGGLAWIFFLGD
ncbi:MAG: hypothetical protein KDA89_09540 [Planctomycetaceae bacterium]|nr:hypothetical protein [Planctomycetaceae bacterium]